MVDISPHLAGPRGAIFSPDRAYRYLLWRRWDGGLNPERARWLLFCGANPSKADAIRSDPTVSQMRGRADRMGFTGLLVVNANAFVSTDPRGLEGLADPCGPENLAYIEAAAAVASFILAAWGNLAGERGIEAERVLRASGKPLHTLALTGGGNPRHPRGVSLEVQPVEWKGI